MAKSLPENQSRCRYHRIIFEPPGIACRASERKSIMEAATDQSISLRSECGGQGQCGKCIVKVEPAAHLTPLTDSEIKILTPDQIQAGLRLACAAKITGALKVSVSESILESKQVFGKKQAAEIFPCRPMVKRLTVSGNLRSELEKRPSRDMVQFIRDKVKDVYGHDLLIDDLASIRMLSRRLSDNYDLTLVSHSQKGITAVLKGIHTRSFGIALDIGTSTLAAYLCDLTSGTVPVSAAASNPQRRFGEDVISRIAFIKRKDSGLEELQRLLLNEINRLISNCVRELGAELQDIDEVAVVGNTVMEQIFMGLDPKGLGFAPFLPVCGASKDLRAGDLGLKINPATNVHVFPVISGFVGGDTLGVILSEKPHESHAVTLIIDIGTNGELVLGNRERLWATSCATGPVFEGAHISCGMRATPGAIHKVAIDPVDTRVDYEVLTDKETTPPRGICGSGMIDTVAGLLQGGLLHPSGRFQEGLLGVIADRKGIGQKFVLVPSHATANNQEIAITLADVRQIQLAKSALSVGIKLLMRKAGIKRFDRLVLTGAFGARFNWKNAVRIGMLPKASQNADVKIVKNAAGRGAIMALLNGKMRKQLGDISRQVAILNLAEDPDFASEFTKATLFPGPIQR